jgi:hypothetical protein
VFSVRLELNLYIYIYFTKYLQRFKNVFSIEMCFSSGCDPQDVLDTETDPKTERPTDQPAEQPTDRTTFHRKYS